jgi:antitoxin VapB
MKKAKLFKNGQSQAVRLPREFQFEGTEVMVKRAVNCVVLIAIKNSWDALIQRLEMISADFMLERDPNTQRVANISSTMP